MTSVPVAAHLFKRALQSPLARLMRLDKPIGAFLLFWPCAFGLAAASLADGNWIASLYLMPLFATGALAMRAAGCVWNDLVDRDLDKSVKRTASRPLASGAITPAQAVILMGLLCLGGLAILYFLNAEAVLWAVASAPLIAAYPFMKRITHAPQVWLGLVFSWGAIVGWVSRAETLESGLWWLYAGCVFWTLGYDTIYAYQDKEDDPKVGIKSLALVLGEKARSFLVMSYSLTILCFFVALCSWVEPYKAAGLLLPAMHLAYQVRRFQPDSPKRCGDLFRSNQWTGALFLLAIASAAY